MNFDKESKSEEKNFFFFFFFFVGGGGEIEKKGREGRGEEGDSNRKQEGHLSSLLT